MERKTFSVTGMSCDGCEQNVTSALRTLDGVNRIEADHEDDAIEVVADDSVTDNDIHDAIEQAGYEVVT